MKQCTVCLISDENSIRRLRVRVAPDSWRGPFSRQLARRPTDRMTDRPTIRLTSSYWIAARRLRWAHPHVAPVAVLSTKRRRPTHHCVGRQVVQSAGRSLIEAIMISVCSLKLRRVV